MSSQEDEVLEERKAVVAFLYDRAAQYRPGNACLVALEDMAVAIAHGEHVAAWHHGELEDLRARVERILAERTS